MRAFVLFLGLLVGHLLISGAIRPALAVDEADVDAALEGLQRDYPELTKEDLEQIRTETETVRPEGGGLELGRPEPGIGPGAKLTPDEKILMDKTEGRVKALKEQGLNEKQIEAEMGKELRESAEKHGFSPKEYSPGEKPEQRGGEFTKEEIDRYKAMEREVPAPHEMERPAMERPTMERPQGERGVERPMGNGTGSGN